MALEARLLPAGGTQGVTVHHALNDVVVARGALARVVRMTSRSMRATSRRSSPMALSS